VVDKVQSKSGGSEWESNPSSLSKITIAGFEDQDDHRTACASEFTYNRRSSMLSYDWIIIAQMPFVRRTPGGTATSDRYSSSETLRVAEERCGLGVSANT
jgi:hypothetical protein